MGACFSNEDKVQPQELNSFPSPPENIAGNEEDSKKFTENRTTTDLFFLFVIVGFYISLVGLITYCILHGDIYRILYGYDNCANICGVQNYAYDDNLNCKGVDTREFPFLLIKYAYTEDVDINYVTRMCVDNCTNYKGYRTFLNRCVPEENKYLVNTFVSKLGLKNFFQEASDDIYNCWREIVYMCLMSLLFSCIIMVMLRFFVGAIVWIVLIGVSIICVAGTILAWIFYSESKKGSQSKLNKIVSDLDANKQYTFLFFAIVATIISLAVLIIIIVLRKRIQLIVQLFKEAGKAIAATPLLLLQPLLTFVCLCSVIGLWFYFSLWIESAGYLKAAIPDLYNYEKDFLIKFTRWYNIFGMLWMAQFIIGCQHMIIAGTVASWYFMRDKTKLGNPILYSTYNLLKYHLGSVALGSFLISLVQFIRIVLAILQKYLKNRKGTCVNCILKTCQCCLYIFEKLLKFISRNAYIEVAMYGYSFCKAGHQAFKLLVNNALRVTVINSVGDFVLFLAKILIVGVTVFFGTNILRGKEGILHLWVPLTLGGVIAYFVANCFLTVYEMAIDTIFLCFCEDCERNDGISRPYFMSRGLMEYVQNSKKVLAYFDASESKTQAWQEGPTTISSKVQ